MRHRIVRRVASALLTVALGLIAPAASVGLSCVGFQDVERAAREALVGIHPAWAQAYIVGRVDAIEHPQHAPTVLTVTPTHVFGTNIDDLVRLAARSDGPPDPMEWHVGAHYFLAMTDAPELEDVHALIAPCAPNFRIVGTDQVDRLVRAAPDVEVRGEVSIAPPDAPLGAAALLGAVGVVGLGSWLAFGPTRRGRR